MAAMYKKKIKLLIIPLLITALLNSCLYKMPTDDDMNTVPTTNNPNVVRDTPGLIPGINM